MAWLNYNNRHCYKLSLHAPVAIRIESTAISSPVPPEIARQIICSKNDLILIRDQVNQLAGQHCIRLLKLGFD